MIPTGNFVHFYIPEHGYVNRKNMFKFNKRIVRCKLFLKEAGEARWRKWKNQRERVLIVCSCTNETIFFQEAA